MPGPILFGFAFDKACIVWREKCDTRGSCWIYEGDKLNVNLAIMGIVVKAFSCIFFCKMSPLLSKIFNPLKFAFLRVEAVVC